MTTAELSNATMDRRIVIDGASLLPSERDHWSSQDSVDTLSAGFVSRFELLRNQVYIGRVDVPGYGISTRGDFEPLVTEKVFYRVQAILDGRLEMTAPRQRSDPDFPLRGYVRCEACGRPLTASWSKGRNDYYAYYHCSKRCSSTSSRGSSQLQDSCGS